ncbi:MarR family winged helix-turn-helix transcriptional regulator [Corynebacterium ulceribovis]|uniref:MarR family winged helix-turn-helix transcriptional regulator n=1 Tax=Corynebacterium ulceribovis TaxID=487732 RepID=UPI000364C9D9|nr:MarR family winged helix-turn-helix transcriptional regulator [Corynebacterium ulceribovis]
MGQLTENDSRDDAQVPWLNATEQAFWRSVLAATRGVDRAIEMHLLEHSKISSADFSVLVVLSEAPQRSLRMRELCDKLTWDRSRLSHQIGRMEKRGLVEKQRSESDARGIDVAITQLGYDTIVEAAPDHVRIVRELVFDNLEGVNLDLVRSYVDRVHLAASEDCGECAGPPMPAPPAGTQ